MFLDFDSPMANNEFISIMVMSYFRPEMTLALLRSLHSLADFPFEIILHDDHSDGWVRDRVYGEMRELCSTMILGQGDVNMGFAAAANRGTALCNSKYVLLLNNDCLMVNPCFQQIKQVLDVPYIASTGVRDIIHKVPGAPHDDRPIVHANGQSFLLSNLPHGSGAFAFKKDVWFEHGGFPQVYNNGGDIAFLFSLLKRGWFHAGDLISPDGQPSYRAFRNLDQENGYKATTSQHRNFDQAYPRIFPFCNRQAWFYEECEKRRVRRYPLSQEQYLSDRGHHNIDYWGKWSANGYDGNGGINWDALEDFGQSKWRDQIDADIQAWKNLGGES